MIRGTTNVTTTIITPEVAKITYAYHADGAVEPYINFYPGIALDEYTYVTKLPLHSFSSDSDFDIAAGDVLSLSASKDDKILAKITTKSANRRINLKLDKCPVCGSKLIQFTPDGPGCCLNRSCGAQLYSNLLAFLATMGISLTGINGHIISSLVCRGKLTSIVDIFMLNYSDICDGCITESEARIFIQYIHSIRGHVTIDQLLKSLVIPGLKLEDIESIRNLFIINKFTLLDVQYLFDKSITSQYKGIDWTAWERFISIDANRELIVRLCAILYI